MQYFYVAMWFIVGLLLIFKLSKENKIFYFAGGFFLLLGAWWLADALAPDDLFAGTWGTALRIVTLIALVVLGAVFFIERQRMINQEAAEMKKKAEEREKGPVDDGPRASVAGINIMRPQTDDEEEEKNED